MSWYFRGIEKDKEDKSAHVNVSDVFDELKLSDEQIRGQMSKYKIQNDWFYYYLGLAYYDKRKWDRSLYYYNEAIKVANTLQKDIHKVYNSIGITYDEMRDYEKAKQYYNLCIETNPKYFNVYYNMAIVYKG